MSDPVRLDRAYLAELGLARLSEDDQDSLLATLYDQLQTRVGTRLTAALTRTQLDEFEALTEAGDDQGCSAFLDDQVPDYKNVVREEHAALTASLEKQVPLILAELAPEELDARRPSPS
ncbi:MAG: DUF5663 domain-containing protein [Candidatus Nanopelagicales bacterium]